jgi:hypothetical protein
LIDLAYIQKKNGEFINETAFNFWHGCQMLGIQTIPFVAEEIEQLDLRKETLVHGYIGTVRRAFDRIRVAQPHLDEGPPEEILKFYGRNMWATTMKEVRERLAEDRHIFIKPLRKQKAFNGHVTSGAIRDLIQTAGFDDDFEILASEPVEFVTEYRLFVHHGLVSGCRVYRGDFTKMIDFSVVFEILKAFKKQPIGFSLDMGLTSDGRTLVVEVNDAFALGSYGQPSIPYAQMVIDRWCQIVGIQS